MSPLLIPALLLIALISVLFLAERKWPEQVDRLEENILAILLAAITIVSFTQVIARYGFNSGWGGALEATRILFAWLILFGMSYGFKKGSHLGVDVFIRMLPKPLFKLVALFGAFCVLIYGLMFLYGGWLSILGVETGSNWRQSGAIGYWRFMFDRGTGLDDLRWPEILQSTFGLQERVQRWIAYIFLPVGLALLCFRALQGMIQIALNQREILIAGHEAEDLVAENRDSVKE